MDNNLSNTKPNEQGVIEQAATNIQLSLKSIFGSGEEVGGLTISLIVILVLIVLAAMLYFFYQKGTFKAILSRASETSPMLLTKTGLGSTTS